MRAVRTLPMTATLLLIDRYLSGPNGHRSPRSFARRAPNPWSFSFSAYTYLLPDSENYANPNFTADHGGLHLEARYNYEALKRAHSG